MDFEEKVVRFVGITDCSDAIARKYLEACAGDLDMAIGMHLESQGGSGTQQESRPTGSSTAHVSEELLSPMSYEKVYVTFMQCLMLSTLMLV